MKLKTFDIYDMLDGVTIEKAQDILQAVASHCLYAPQNHTMGICLIEEKPAILNIIQKYGEELNIPVRVQGNFVNLDKELVGDNVDWDDIWVSNDFAVNSDDFWKSFVKLTKANEQRLLDAEDFAFEWNCMKKEALLDVIDKWHANRMKEQEETYAEVKKLWTKMDKVPLF